MLTRTELFVYWFINFWLIPEHNVRSTMIEVYCVNKTKSYVLEWSKVTLCIVVARC